MEAAAAVFRVHVGENGTYPKPAQVTDPAQELNVTDHIENTRIVSSDISFVPPKYRDAQDALGYITGCTSALRKEYDRTTAGAPPVTIELPRLAPEDETRYRVAIGETLKGASGVLRGVRKDLLQLLDHVQEPVRVIPYFQNGKRIGVIHYKPRIPESLRRLIVLDASHNIRRLTSQHDATIRETLVDCRVKSFDAVSVCQYVQGAGRDALDEQLPRKDSPATLRLMSILSEYPKDEGVVVVTFKPESREARLGKSHADHLQRRMRRAGIDPQEKLSNGKDRFVFLTWGQHIGVSHYAYCRHVLCVGVLRRNTLDIAASITALRADLLTPFADDLKEVNAVVLSEMFHNVMQAAGRGACRSTRNGKAERMSVSLLCSEVFPLEWWQEAMPGVVVTEEHPGKKERAAKDTAEVMAVIEALDKLPSADNYIASRTLKTLAGMQHLSSNAYKRLLQKVAAHPACTWHRDGRSLRRFAFKDETLFEAATQF